MEYVDDAQLIRFVKQSSGFKLKQGMRVTVLPKHLVPKANANGRVYSQNLEMERVDGRVYTVEVTNDAGEIAYLSDNSLGIVCKEWVEQA